MVSRISKILDFALPVFYFLLAVSFYLRTYDSAMVKISEVYMFGTILIALWLCKIFEGGRWPFSKSQTLTVLPFLLILFSGILSFFRSPLPWGSFDFFVRRAIYIGIALITVAEVNSLEDFRRVTRYLMAALIVSVSYGVFQWIDVTYFPSGPPSVGLDKFVWRGAFGKGRIFSTFGNPNFFGNYLVIFVPLIVSYIIKFFREKQYHLSFFMFLFLGATLFCINRTGSKGPAMGLIGGTVVFSFLYIKFLVESKKIRTFIFSSALVIILLLGGYVYLRLFKWGDIYSIPFRLYTWLSTWEMVNAKPVLGNGIGTFWVLYPAYRRPAIFHIEGKHNTETDHAENEHLEVWMDEGLAGMGLWIWFIAMNAIGIYYTLARASSVRARDGPNKDSGKFPEEVYYMLGFLSGFLGMLIHNITDVSMRFVSSGAPFWFIAGLNTSLILYSPLKDKHSDSSLDTIQLPLAANAMKQWALRFFRWIAIAVTAVVSLRILREFDWCQMRDGFANPNEAPHFVISWIFFLACWGACSWWFIRIALGASRIKTLAALVATDILLIPLWGFFLGDVNHNRAIFFSKQGIWNRASQYDNSVAGFPPEYRQMYSGLGLRSAEDKTLWNRWMDSIFPDRRWRAIGIGGALEHYEEVNRLRPDFIMAHYFRGNVYNDWGSQMASKSNEAFKIGDTAQGEIFRKQADELWNKSIAAYKQTRKLGPNYVQMHHQVGLIHHKWADFFSNLAPLAEKYGKKDLAENYRKSSKDHLIEALNYYDLYHKIDPVYDQNYYRRAQIHIQLAELEKAEQIYLDYIEAEECRKPYHQIFGGIRVEKYSNSPIDKYDMASPFHRHDTARPSHPEAWLLLGDFYQFMKRSDSQAESAYKKAVDLNPKIIDFPKKLAIFYSSRNRVPEALAFWKQVYDLNPQDSDIQKFLQANPHLRR